MPPQDAHLRLLQKSDLPTVLAIIEDFDEDDAQGAQHTYENEGLQNHFVLERQGQVIGVIGFRSAEGTDHTFWLSWTYLDSDFRGQGYGHLLLSSLLDKLRQQEGRKVFVSTSDYHDPEDGDIYAAANQLYQRMGFVEELVHPDYFELGESELVYGLTLQQPLEAAPLIEEECNPVNFTGMFEIKETDDSWAFEWGFTGTLNFSAEDVQTGLKEAARNEARSVFVAFPSNLTMVRAPLEEAGFQEVGQLQDYFSDGLHEIHFRYTF